MGATLGPGEVLWLGSFIRLKLPGGRHLRVLCLLTGRRGGGRRIGFFDFSGATVRMPNNLNMIRGNLK
jgi:hypothetical protein